jgi:hypothetical protein
MSSVPPDSSPIEELCRCSPDGPCEEVLARLRGADRARELVGPDDAAAAAALGRLRQRARWQAMGHNYGQGEAP